MQKVEFSRKEAVIAFYRDELRKRYTLKNVRRFAPFEPISDSDIAALRDYFLDNIYPPPAERRKLDDAFEQLGAIIKSPRRLQPLMAAALGAFWRFGRQLPAAVSAGRNTFDAYRESRKLEEHMVRNADTIGLGPEDADKRERMLMLLANVPEEDVVRLIEDILTLFRTISNVELLSTTADIMDHFVEIMRGRPELYSENECAGIALGTGIVRGGLALFRQMAPEQLPMVVDGIREVEYDWFERIKAEAGV